MPERELKRKTPASRSTDEKAENATSTTEARGGHLKEEMDDLLDEIDAVLEENAEEFVRNYVQKGGE